MRNPFQKVVFSRGYGGQNSTHFEIWEVAIGRDEPAVLLLQGEFQRRNAELSPDGNWLTYRSDQTGTRPHYASVLQAKRYVYGQHWAPHDIRVRELGTGKSRLETAQSHGITFQVTPNIGVDDGIDAARLLLPRCWFDEEKCRSGLEALTFYRKTYNERLQAFTDKPVHDWSSHGADAFRGLAVRHKPPRRERPRRRKRFAGREAPVPSGRLGWMH